MRAPLLILTGLAALTQATSNITCSSPITSGTLWYGNTTHGSYEGQVGILEAYGNAELLAKYPNTNVVAHNFTIIPCNSSYLNVTNPSPLMNSDSYIKLQLTDDPANCLGLEFPGSADVFVIKQACSYTDDDSQAYQFWTRKEKWHYLLPTGQKQPAVEWNLQFNQYDTEEVIANPGVCFEGQECQDGKQYSLLVKP